MTATQRINKRGADCDKHVTIIDHVNRLDQERLLKKNRKLHQAVSNLTLIMVHMSRDYGYASHYRVDVTSAREHIRGVTNALPASWERIEYLRGTVDGKGEGVGHRNSYSPNGTQQQKLLLHVRILQSCEHTCAARAPRSLILKKRRGPGRGRAVYGAAGKSPTPERGTLIPARPQPDAPLFFPRRPFDSPQE
ncbi:hypothetical protein EVAR_85449_1 [Eumeta japonica]|uniref:Uncharacterized protein n=1 Tax=Eumeta variegata TaxID=151549 RepID=A0A4C1WIG1_EUMVA|nr:hypothetical protein EVAR_85449_1 [Eumeta japonica]